MPKTYDEIISNPDFTQYFLANIFPGREINPLILNAQLVELLNSKVTIDNITFNKETITSTDALLKHIQSKQSELNLATHECYIVHAFVCYKYLMQKLWFASLNLPLSSSSITLTVKKKEDNLLITYSQKDKVIGKYSRLLTGTLYKVKSSFEINTANAGELASKSKNAEMIFIHPSLMKNKLITAATAYFKNHQVLEPIDLFHLMPLLIESQVASAFKKHLASQKDSLQAEAERFINWYFIDEAMRNKVLKEAISTQASSHTAQPSSALDITPADTNQTMSTIEESKSTNASHANTVNESDVLERVITVDEIPKEPSTKIDSKTNLMTETDLVTIAPNQESDSNNNIDPRDLTGETEQSKTDETTMNNALSTLPPSHSSSRLSEDKNNDTQPPSPTLTIHTEDSQTTDLINNALTSSSPVIVTDTISTTPDPITTTPPPKKFELRLEHAGMSKEQIFSVRREDLKAILIQPELDSNGKAAGQKLDAALDAITIDQQAKSMTLLSDVIHHANVALLHPEQTENLAEAQKLVGRLNRERYYSVAFALTAIIAGAACLLLAAAIAIAPMAVASAVSMELGTGMVANAIAVVCGITGLGLMGCGTALFFNNPLRNVTMAAEEINQVQSVKLAMWGG